MKAKFFLTRPRKRKKIAIGIFNGIALRYLLQTSFIDRLVENGVQVLVITSQPTSQLDNLVKSHDVSLKLVPDSLCQQYSEQYWPNVQWFARIVRLHVYGSSNTTGEVFWARYWSDVDARILESSPTIAWEYRVRRWLVGKTISLLRKSETLRRWFLSLEVRFFTPKIYQKTLKEFDADEVVVTSLGTFDWDQYLLRDAQQLGISSVSIILSWDNTTVRGYAGGRPNRVVAWTQMMKIELINLHDFCDHEVFVGGVPIFDHYFSELHDGPHFTNDWSASDKQIIFFATKSPNAFPWNPNVVRTICEAIRNHILPNCILVVRVHPLHYRRKDGVLTFQTVLESYEKLKREYPTELVLDVPHIEDSSMNYVMPAEEIEKLSQLLRRAAVVVNMFSTLNIEAAIFDKPLINVCYEGEDKEYSIENKARFNIMSDMAEAHNRRIVDTGGLHLVYNSTQLVEAIQLAFSQPDSRNYERKQIVEREAGPYRGSAGKVIADYVSCC